MTPLQPTNPVRSKSFVPPAFSPAQPALDKHRVAVLPLKNMSPLRQIPFESCDVIVVGARVAGSTLAALLGDAGIRVLLVDTATFPSPTISTHFFRGSGMVAVLSRLGVLDEVLSLGPPPLTCQYSYRDGEAKLEPPQEPGEIGYALSVRREPLDYILVRRASRCPSVFLAEKTSVIELIWDEGRVAGVRLHDSDGNQSSVRGRMVVGADGRNSFVARAVKANLQESTPPSRALYYVYVRGFVGPAEPPNGPEFSLLGDEMAYVFPSDAGVTCIALTINLTDFEWLRKQPLERFQERLAHHKELADRFASSKLISRLSGSGPQPNYVRVPFGPGWALVGDAGLHQDPWSGEGIDMAGVHATFLAESLISCLCNATSKANALATYHSRRDNHALAIYHDTVTFARDLRQLPRE